MAFVGDEALHGYEIELPVMPARWNLRPLRCNVRNSRAGWEWFHWLPVHGLDTEDLFRIIGKAGQTPRCAYAAGMSKVTTPDPGDHRDVLDFI